MHCTPVCTFTDLKYLKPFFCVAVFNCWEQLTAPLQRGKSGINLSSATALSLHSFTLLFLLQVDIGKGLLVSADTWAYVKEQHKDSIFVKSLLVAVWDPATLRNKSLGGI